MSHSINISFAGCGAGSADARQLCIMNYPEVVPHADATGMPFQGGGIVQVAAFNVGSPTTAFVTLPYGAVLGIRSQGAIAYS